MKGGQTMKNKRRKQDILDVVKESGMSIETFYEQMNIVGGYQVCCEDYMSSGDRSILEKLKQLMRQRLQNGTSEIQGRIEIRRSENPEVI